MSAMRWVLGGRTAAAAAGAAASVASGSNTSHARAPVVTAAHPELRHQDVKCIEDEWLDVAHSGGNIILFQPFKPYEIDEAFLDVAQLVRPNGERNMAVPLVSGPGQADNDSGASTPTSDGSQADSEIARACFTSHSLYGEDASRNFGPGMDVMTLLNLTNRMLKRPGMQAEIAKAMMEDPDIQQILLREGGDLDSYLTAAGAPAVRLLPPAAAASLDPHASGHDAGSAEGNPLSNVLQGLLSNLAHMGSGIGSLLGWLRNRLSQLFHGANGNGAADGAAAGAPAAQRGGAGSHLWKGVMAVAIIAMVVMIMKRPPTSLTFIRAAAGVAAAGAGAAASQDTPRAASAAQAAA